MGARFAPVAGISVEPVGEIWAAYSHVSGETLLLNNESAAVLEIVALGSACADEVVDVLASDCGVGRDELAAALADCWPLLVDAGLVRQIDGVSDLP